MLTTSVPQQVQLRVTVRGFDPDTLFDQVDRKISRLLSKLSPGTPWGDRRKAVQELGSLRNPAALPYLLDTLSNDPFWMVRYAVIEALQMIGDPRSTNGLVQAAERDGFQAIRSYAAKVVKNFNS